MVTAYPSGGLSGGGGGGGGAGANVSLSNLAAVAVNASLIAGADDAIDLGSSALRWRSAYFSQTVELLGAASDANPKAVLGIYGLRMGPGAATAVNVGLEYGAPGVIIVSDGTGGTGGVFQRLATSVKALTDAATISVDASQGNHFTCTITASRTIGNPTNAKNGQKMVFDILQDGTGGWTISLDTKFKWPTELPATALSGATTTANTHTLISCVYNSTDDRFWVTGVLSGYAA